MQSHIWDRGKQIHLGSFKEPAEAARAYDQAAIMFRGWDAETNFAVEGYLQDPVLLQHIATDSKARGGELLRLLAAVCALVLFLCGACCCSLSVVGFGRGGGG